MKNEIIQLKHKDLKEYRNRILKTDQNGLCAICNKIPKRPVLDHHHKKKIKGTGLVRGVIDSNMNVFLAKIENNAMRYGISNDDLPDILRSIANYMEKEQYPLIHPTEAPKEKKLKKSSYNKLLKVYKESESKLKFPSYPKSKRLTKPLEKFFNRYNILPEYYK